MTPVAEFSGDFIVYIFLPDNGTSEKTRGHQQQWARKMVNLFRESGSAEYWAATLGTAAKTLGVYLTPLPPPASLDPGLYVDFFAKTLGFAIFRENPDRHYR